MNKAIDEAKKLLDILLIAANAKTDEEKARVAWRANDYMWGRCMRDYKSADICRQFNNLLQDQNWPWVKDLWSAEELRSIGEDNRKRWDLQE